MSRDPAVPVSTGEDVKQELSCVDTSAKVETLGYTSHRKPTRDGLMLGDDEFFRRPVVIGTYNYTNSGTVTHYYPWKLWLNDAMIKARLLGRTFVRGTLCLRFDCTPSPFHYGLVRAAISFGAGHEGTLRDCSAGSSFWFASHALGVDIDMAVPGAHILRVPFIFPDNYLSIVDVAPCPYQIDTSSLPASSVICTLSMVPLEGLNRAESVSVGSVDIVIRAWVEDFESVGATRFEFIPQSGPISGTAFAIGRAAKELSGVPVLAGFGAAVAAGAQFVGTVATLFGYSRPPEAKIKRVQIGHAAPSATDGHLPIQRATLTEEQGLSREFGGGDAGLDDMALSRIWSRNTLLDHWLWESTEARGNVIAAINVDPMSGKSSGSVRRATLLAYATKPFAWWRGTIIYTVRVVCSKYHQGSLRIVFEPAGSRADITGGSSIESSWSLAGLENCIIDLQAASAQEIEVGYTSKDLWTPVAADLVGEGAATDKCLTCAGRIGIIVENPLQAPLDTSSVRILLYARGGDDFQVMGFRDSYYPLWGTDPTPDGGLTNARRLEQAPPSDDASHYTEDYRFDGEGVRFIPEAESYGTTTVGGRCKFGQAQKPTGVELRAATFGEAILSLRALLKRYYPLGTFVGPTDATAVDTSKFTTVHFPLFPPDLGHTAGNSNDLTYTAKAMNFYRYFRLLYVGQRGGARFRVRDIHRTRSTAGAVVGPASFSMAVAPWNATGNDTTTLYSADASIPGIHVEPAGNGTVTADTGLGEFPEFEIPDYNPAEFRYSITYGGALGRASGTVPMPKNSHVQLTVQKECLNFAHCAFAVDQACADDFSFFFLNGVPSDLYTY